MLDSWHCRLLRRTMKVKTTVIDRSKPNRWVYQHASAEKLSETIARRQIKYFAHIARHSSDITHTVCYGPPHIPRRLNSTRRRGRPRHHWTPHVEQSTIACFSAAGRPPTNRQHLFRICEDRKFVKKVTDRRPPVMEAQHAGAGGNSRIALR